MFSGTWYKIGGLPTTEEISVNCTKYEYIQTATGYSVDATGVDANKSPTEQNSVLRQQASNIGRFSTKLSQIEADIAVINTDYDNYACLHSCYDIKEAFHVQQAWIIYRTRQPSRDHIALCQKALFEVGVPIRLLEKVHQGSECTN
ncbi:hypothetical protein Pcinc_016167 [Petrolisthes cinctipes]|uniref:Lipocalin/cytosolic fatty-acid binding domain-containing protein n=1 Tax=Petrolisthes cinctipes TaxID=88211 RepID=A0AAE1FTC8_PETCI|nr:hypothetical protein Pcinc_016167 [Petrolisthes cinctipes]